MSLSPSSIAYKIKFLFKVFQRNDLLWFQKSPLPAREIFFI